MADKTTTAVNHDLQGSGGNIVELARDYYWLRATLGLDRTNEAVEILGDQVETLVNAIANTPAQSIHDMRAKMAIFRLEEGGDLSDHNALALIKSLTADLDAWPLEAPAGALAAAAEADAALHGRHYNDLLRAIVAVRALNGDGTEGSDDRRDDAASAVNSLFEDLMECPSSSLEGLLFKVRGAHHYAVDHTEAVTTSPRFYSELLAIIAADLEILMAGSAVRS
jgi:hypothetical protein